MHGWFWLLCPYLSLYVSAPAASAISWFPRHLPRIGLLPSRAFLMCSIVTAHIFGSPGPLLIMIASYSSFVKSKSQGTLVTEQPLCSADLIMLFFTPQSMRRILGEPGSLYTFLSLTETSATRFLLFGSLNSGVSLQTILPSITPFSLSFFVSALVSIPFMPGMLCSTIHSCRLFFASQWL